MGNRLTLKECTLRSHLNAEARWLGTDGFSSLAVYRDWLDTMLDIHLSLGLSAAKALSKAGQTMDESARLRALCADLQRLEQKPTDVAPMETSRAWGVQYVLNGSALGAATLMKPGQLHRDWPARYLSEMANYAKSGKLKAFFDQLDAAPIDVAVAEIGARDVFLMAS